MKRTILFALVLCMILCVYTVSANNADESKVPPVTTPPQEGLVSTTPPTHHDEENDGETTTITASVTVKEEDSNQSSNASTSASNISSPQNSSSSQKQVTTGKPKNKSKRTIQITIPKDYEKYQLKPRVIGEDQKIRFYNAQNTTFYQRKLKNPILKLWILIVGRKMKNNLPYFTYSARRFFETAWRRNIQVELMEIQKFDLLVSHDGSNSLIYDGEVVPRDEFPDVVLPRLGAQYVF